MALWIFILLLLGTPCLAAETTVHSLNAVPGAIKTPEGKRAFADQIEGKTDTTPLGTVLPAGLSRETIIKLVAPQADASLVTLVGAKPWAHLTNGYVAIVCVAPNAEAKKEDAGSLHCDDRPEVDLGVLTMAPGGAATLVARTPPGFLLTSDWAAEGTPLLYPSVAPVDPGNDNEFPPGRGDAEVSAFDLAPYRLAPDVFAFGLRSDQYEGYAGGGANFETLHLFVAEGATLRRVLAQPIYASSMIAGEWHKNGTRDHQFTEAKLVLAIASSLTAGHYDLRVRELGTKREVMLHWNAAAGVYWVPGSGS